MRHRIAGRRLSKSSAQRRALLRGLTTALFEHDKIRTTLPRAKELRSTAEKMITIAKRGLAPDGNRVHAQRQVLRFVYKRSGDLLVVQRLFEEIAPRYVERDGGYTRIIRIGHRSGDGTQMAMIELLD
jgi:large subunit ribosomal protein L17